MRAVRRRERDSVKTRQRQDGRKRRKRDHKKRGNYKKLRRRVRENKMKRYSTKF